MSQKQNENGFDRIIEIELNAAAALSGALFWVMLSIFRYDEAWNDPFYWDFGVPGMMVTSFCFGWNAPDRATRRGAWMGIGHGVGALFAGLIHGNGFNYWPHMSGLGVIFTVFLSMAAATGGFFARRRRAIK